MEQITVGQRPSLSLTRVYPVAPEKVWRAWTDAEAVKRWWGPGPGEPVSAAELDVRVGGRFRFKHEQLFDEKVRDSHKQGWSALLENLEAFVSA